MRTGPTMPIDPPLGTKAVTSTTMWVGAEVYTQTDPSPAMLVSAAFDTTSWERKLTFDESGISPHEKTVRYPAAAGPTTSRLSMTALASLGTPPRPATRNCRVEPAG